MTQTQRETNPFVFSDTNKRYHTYDFYLRRTFGGKVAKIPLDAGLTCPNLDGTCGRGGCVYCSGRGSGDFAPAPQLSLRAQFDSEWAALSGKWKTGKCLPYLQAHSNTYAPLSRLIPLYDEALALPGAVGLNIATRADCLPDEVLRHLQTLTTRGVITLELGLQSSSDRTAEKIGRGHTFAVFADGFYRARRLCPDVKLGVHIILGLPGEGEAEIMKTARDLAALRPDFVKIHLLHVLRGTKLADWYLAGDYEPPTRDTYVGLVVRVLECLPPETVIERLTGDGKKEDLLAPLWSRDKLAVINEIDKAMFRANTWQGKCLDLPEN